MNTDLDSLDVGPDWLTVTASGGQHVQRLRRQSARYLDGLGKSRQWRFLQYIGHKYHDAEGQGGVAYGETAGGEGCIFQAWGPLANLAGTGIVCGERFWDVDEQPVEGDPGAKVTRCDLQVTVLYSHPTPQILEILGDLPKDRHHYSAIVPLNEEGGTLYVGQRSSDLFGRLYDKGAQLGAELPPCTLWRFEVEYKRGPARAVAASLWGPCTTPADRRAFILTNVETFFRERGIPTPFIAPVDERHSVVRFGTRQQDAARTLKWLSQQVKPALFRLSLAGKAEAVSDALGLTVIDGMPVFEAMEVVPCEQLDFFSAWS